MAYLNPNEAFENFRDRTLEGIRAHFPIKGWQQTLELTKLVVEDNLHPDDLRAQHEAKNKGESYAVPVYAHLVLKNTQTGEVIDRKKTKIADIPKMTQRYSYIVNGQEYQVDNQWQLKPGAYVRRRKSGEIETRFNVRNGQSFDVTLDDKSKQFFAEYKKSKVPLYPLMKTMGVDDDTLERTWGKEIFNASKNARGVDGAMQRMYKTMTKQDAPSKAHATEYIYNAMLKSEMRPDSTEYTLGKPIVNVNGDALTLATQKMLHVHQGKAAVDDRDSIIFKDLRSAGDYVNDKLLASIKGIRTKASRKLGSATKIGDIIHSGMFNEPIRNSFHDNAASKTAKQINPLEMVSSAMQTTLTGSGGIQSDRAITDEAKFVDPSHLGYLDPINTPEGNSTGVSLRLPMGVKKVGNTPMIRLHNMKTGQMEDVPPARFMASNVLLADQVTWKDGKPVPKFEGPLKMAGPNNAIQEKKFEEAHYVMKHPSQMFNMTSNLVPFMHSVQGNRAGMATRHMEQSISLLHREVPLVQVATGVEHHSANTFEKVMGYQTSHTSPVAGTVTSITPGGINIEHGDGTHEVQTYNNFPLNDAKSVLHSEPLVKVGDKVKAGQVVADTNYTRNGTLALGTNLLTAYVPFRGLNFEDGVVLSETAAKKLSSVHMHKPSIPVKGMVFDKKKFLNQHMGIFKSSQLEHIGDDGLPKVGAKIKPGDPMILAMRPFDIKDRMGVSAIRKSLLGMHSDKSMVWDGETEGEVVDVLKKKDAVEVHIRSVEPMQIGDKLCFDEQTEVLTSDGWKPVDMVTLWDEVCCLVDGCIRYENPTELHAYPTGGRMYRIESQQVDLFVTEAHRMWVKRRNSADFELLPAKDICGQRVRYSKHGNWSGVDPEFVLFPSLSVTEGQFGHGSKVLPEIRMPVDLFVTLLGAYLSNGSSFWAEDGGNYGIKIDKATERMDVLVHALKVAGLEHACVDHGNCTSVVIRSKQLATYFRQFDHAGDKFIPAEVFGWSKNTLHLLLKWLMWGDGYSEDGRYVYYTTVSKKLADGIQQLCLHAGYAANIGTTRGEGWQEIKGKRCYCQSSYRVAIVTTKLEPQVNHGHTKKQKAQQEYQVEEYTEPVFCITVPSHVLYVRRNGKAVWSGNSGRYGNKGICYDPETEVLTDCGWRYFYELDGTELICTLGKDRQIEYQKPTNYIEMQHEGPMYRFSGRRLDLMTTPNHDLYVRTPRSKEYRLESAESCIGSVRVHLKTGKWVGERKETFTVPGRPRREGSKDRYEFCEPRTYDMDDFLEFFGYYLTEGYVHSTQISIGQRFKKHPDVYRDIEYVLRRLGYDPHMHDDLLYFNDPRLAHWLSSFGRSLDKFIHREFLALSTDQLHILAGAMFAGDGGVYFIEKDNHTRRELFTSSKRLADDYQELALRLGFCAHVKPQVRKDKKNVEYVVRWSSKGEVYTQEDSRYESRTEKMVAYSGPVFCVEVPNHIIYVRRNGIPVWCGNCVTVLPDSQMPHTRDGKHMEVLLNPSGVPGRLNPGQLLEVAASKIADKTGKPFLVNNFDGKDWNTHIQDELKKHNLSATDELIDPSTGLSIGQVTTGKQHIIKLVHQVDKKVHVTPGMGLVGTQSQDSYDLNLQPYHGQRIGSLGLYAMLAHGSKANIREIQTWKSEGDDPQEVESKRWKSQHVDVWKAIQTGDPLPTPKPTFAFKKFEEMLKATGVSLDKKGHDLILAPLTHKDIVALAPIALKDPGARLEAKVDKKTGDLKTEKGGLFCTEATGGHGGRKWSRIDLAEPMPNPMFEAPIKALTGIKQSEFDDLVAGRKSLNTQGEVVPMRPGLLTGGAAIEHMLQRVDVRNDLAKTKEQLNKVPLGKVDAVLKKVKYLQALDNLGMKANDAYILRAVPVLPPSMRPASPLPDGNIKYADLNHLYMDFGLNNAKLGNKSWVDNMPHEDVAAHREATYDGIKAIMGAGVPYKNQVHKGLLHQISGSSPKEGFFQHTLINKRQDLTMRSTIVPEPNLGLDEVGLPTDHALTLFRPFVVKKLQDMGVSRSPLEAQKEIAKKSTAAVQALDKVMVERPVMMKRDPVLHKYGIQGFQPKRVEGNAIKIHPLVCGGMSADFDGDAMSIFVPISREAVAEVHAMKPTNNLFAESSGKPVYVPSHEGVLGNYKLSMVGPDTKKKFSNPGQVLDAAQKGQIKHDDMVHLSGKPTTAGRIVLATALPQPMQNSMMYDLDKKLDAKGLNTLLTQVGKEHKGSYDVTVNKIKNLGNDSSYGLVPIPLASNAVNNIVDPSKVKYIFTGAHTLSIKDFTPDYALRDKYIGIADDLVAKDKRNTKLTQTERDAKLVGHYMTADAAMKKDHFADEDERKNNLLLMSNSGIKPGWAQYKQLRMAPLLYQDSAGKIIPMPVKKTFSEGIDLADYWTHMHGARRGSVMKTQETRDPGYMSKLIMNTSMDTQITGHDCGTNKGISMSVTERDIHDRVLAHDFKVGQVHIKAGTTITPDIIGQVRSVDKDAKLVVRSPLKCEHAKGICQKCAGLASSGDFHPEGTNIGVIATQTLGERATQLPMKEFHTGGTAGSGSSLVNSFTRLEQLMTLPKKIPNSATIAMSNGTISKIEHNELGTDIYINGKRHHVGNDNVGNPLHIPLPGMDPISKWIVPKVGTKVEAGQQLSDPRRTVINMHDLYDATKSMDKVQNQMTSDLYDLYKDEGIKRRHVEVIVKSMSGHTKVLDLGDSNTGILRGEFHPLSQIQKINADLIRAGKRPIEHKPALKGVNMLPLMVQEDWMAKLQHERLPATLMQAAAMNQKSSIHGSHPIPAAAYAAEFGMTEERSKVPGLGHLSNVSKHHY